MIIPHNTRIMALLKKMQKTIGIGAVLFFLIGMDKDEDACTRSRDGVCSPLPHPCAHRFPARITHEKGEKIPALFNKTLLMEQYGAHMNFLSAARTACELGKYDLAMDYYARGNFFAQAGQVAELLGRKQEAIIYYQKAEGCESAVAELALELVHEAEETHAYETVIKYYEIAGDYEKNQTHHLDAARIARKTKDFVAAIRNYQKSKTIQFVRDDLKKEAEDELSILIEEGKFDKAQELATSLENFMLVHELSIAAEKAEQFKYTN